MANETRVNLQHLLEDIRDSYALPLEEVITVELIANSLDSGASRIDFVIDADHGLIRCIDNGRGMRRSELKDYHNIAVTTKQRGKGIGFAGLGAKLSLLIASSVITESRGPHGSKTATQWHLASSTRAPWKFVPYSGILPALRGTAVTIIIEKFPSPFLAHSFISQTIFKHFSPLLHLGIMENLLRFIYRNGIEFFVEGQKVTLPQYPIPSQRSFRVCLGRSRQPLGSGYLAMREGESDPQAEKVNGLAVSTFGKIIKSGWEWLGVTPKTPERVFGIVEVPALAEILTTNKMDFLNDASSLKKYYRYRKAIQEAILPILRALGEERLSQAEFPRRVKPIAREIEKALGDLVPDFPELSSLVGVRRKIGIGGKFEDLAGVSSPALGTEERIRDKTKMSQPPSNKKTRRKTPGLLIAFEEFGGEDIDQPLGRMAEETVLINTSHPAWQKAQDEGMQEFHIIFSVAWVLSGFLDETRSPQEFVSRFLSLWGNQGRGNLRIL